MKNKKQCKVCERWFKNDAGVQVHQGSMQCYPKAKPKTKNQKLRERFRGKFLDDQGKFGTISEELGRVPKESNTLGEEYAVVQMRAVTPEDIEDFIIEELNAN